MLNTQLYLFPVKDAVRVDEPLQSRCSVSISLKAVYFWILQRGPDWIILVAPHILYLAINHESTSECVCAYALCPWQRVWDRAGPKK